MWRDRLLAITGSLPHPAWGPSHAARVYDLSLALAAELSAPVDEEVIFAAACLHDVGALAPHRRPGVDHAARSAGVAREMLPGIGFPPAKIGTVAEIIRGHMFDADPGPLLEARILHDADTLEFLGAVGISRLLLIAGRDDWTPDAGASIALAERFNRELPARLITSPARELGRRRSAEAQAFLAALGAATGGASL